MKNIKTFEDFINENNSEINEAKKASPKIWKKVDPILNDIQRMIVNLDNIRGGINDNYSVAEIKKMKGYTVLLDSVKTLDKLKDTLRNTEWPDEK